MLIKEDKSLASINNGEGSSVASTGWKAIAANSAIKVM